MTRPVALIRMRPALLALVLGLAALLRAMPAPALTQDPYAGFGFAEHVLCLGTDSEAGIPGPVAPHHDGCDACCLPGGRLAIALPDDVGRIVEPVASLAPDPAKPWPAVAARSPPYEAWSQERAQRGPPSSRVA
jgi:hypothetical protein